MSAEPDSRFERLLVDLAEGDVAFCVVGSFALAVHGAPRASAYVDIVPEASIENLTRLAAVLERLGASREPGAPRTGLSPEELGVAELKLYTDFGQLHLLGDVEGVPPYSMLTRSALEVEVGGRPVMFCSRDDLIAMKRASGRLIDRADLERLSEVELLRLVAPEFTRAVGATDPVRPDFPCS